MTETSIRQRLFYGTGSVATGIFAAAPGLFLLVYLTDTLAVPAALAGWALLLPRLWDVVTDPLMGMISDRTRSRWGRRRPYMLLGCLITPIAFYAVFAGPDMGSPEGNFWLVTGVYILAATFFTIFAIPYLAIPAEITDEPHERTRILSWRMVALVVGILVSGAIAPELIKAGGGGRSGYALMALFLAATLLVTMLGCTFGIRGVRMLPPGREPTAYLRQLLAVASNPTYLTLLACFALQAVATGSMMAGVAYFAKYILKGDESTITILFLCLVLPSFLTMPAWVALAARVSKKACYALSVILFAAGTAMIWFGDDSRLILIYCVVALMGCGYAGTQLFPFSILPDIIAADRETSGETREGVFTGFWTACEKTSIALGGFLTATALHWAGFVESKADVTVEQTPEALSAIHVTFSAGPGILLFASLPILWLLKVPRQPSPPR